LLLLLLLLNVIENQVKASESYNEEVCDMRDLISFIFPIFTPLPTLPWQ